MVSHALWVMVHDDVLFIVKWMNLKVKSVQVELFRNDQHRLRIVVDSENEVDLMVQSRHLRDVIVLVIRGLAQRFNSTSLNSLLKIET